MSAQGGCGCRKARYEVSSRELFVHACHCLDCQNTTGSAFLINMFVDRRDLRTTGEIVAKSLSTASDAGRDVYACAECGTQLWTRYHIAPQNIIHLRAGTLDDTGEIQPAAHIFTRTKQPWLILPSNVPSFEFNYDRNEVWPAESLDRLTNIVAEN
jgi:hypothetical protein